MNKQQQIKAELIMLNSSLKEANTIDENLLIAQLTQDLEGKNITNFSFNYRESESIASGGFGDAWLQCEYYSEKLKKTIIFDYDVCQIYNGDEELKMTPLDDFAMTLADYNDRIQVFESRINFNQ